MPSLKIRFRDWFPYCILPKKVRMSLYRGRSIWNILQVAVIGAVIFVIEYLLLNNFLHWWNDTLASEVLALVAADLPIGVIIAGLVSRRWRRAGAIEELEYAEAERKYDHLLLFFLKDEDGQKRYVVYNRKGKAKGKLAWYALPWVRHIAIVGIIHTDPDWNTLESKKGKQGLIDFLKANGPSITLVPEVASNEELDP